jgi:hypothetical protein
MNSSSKQYQKIVSILKKRKTGAVLADISSAAALPLDVVRELLPRAADEYSGRLQVTESGEILYSFPDGFSSRYRGFSATVKKYAMAIAGFLRKVTVFLFKTWIMVMLIGYFIMFLVLAVASVFLQSSSKSKSRNSFGLFNILWRFWFVNEITRPRYSYKRGKKNSRAMYKSIFSFVFGEDDPNADFHLTEKKALIKYIVSNKGVISLAEYMSFTGQNSLQAQTSILSFCAQFAGSPEVTEEGSIVYRFDDLLKRSDKPVNTAPPIKKIKTFSDNARKMNICFAVINGVNLLFGSYYLHQAAVTGPLSTNEQYNAASRLYSFTHALFNVVSTDPASAIKLILGVIPLAFSIFFWLIPLVRYIMLQKENENYKLQNFRKFAFEKIWKTPINVQSKDLSVEAPECRPNDLITAGERAILDMALVSQPEIQAAENGDITYSFAQLEKEKDSLAKYRLLLDPKRSSLGKTVFDSA